MSTALVARLLRLAGVDAPTAMPLIRSLTRCPRSRLVRAVSWCAWECGRGLPTTSDLLEGIRALARGWDDYYRTTSLPSRAALVSLETPGEAGVALVKRRGRIGRGWSKDDLVTRGPVRIEIAVGARWLDDVVGCVVHDDCADDEELAHACAASRAREVSEN